MEQQSGLDSHDLVLLNEHSPLETEDGSKTCVLDGKFDVMNSRPLGDNARILGI